jgi:hypothetical protein
MAVDNHDASTSCSAIRTDNPEHAAVERSRLSEASGTIPFACSNVTAKPHE